MIIIDEKEVYMMFFLDYCSNLRPVINILHAVVSVIQFGIPIVLIIFGMIDLGRAVIAGKEDEMKKAQGTLIRRFIYAIAVFLIVTLVTFIMGIVGDSETGADTDTWLSCWNQSNNVE